MMMEIEKGLSEAVAVVAKHLTEAYGKVWRNLQFEHKDESGYWFTYELVQDNRRQTWCVRHSEIRKASTAQWLAESREDFAAMAKYDISFCLSKSCDRTDCARHRSRMPVGIPVSASDFSGYRDASGGCEFFFDAGRDIGAVKLDLNAATEEELVGVGFSKAVAARIVYIREGRGGFKSVSDLLKIRGIGKAKYDKVCNKLEVKRDA